MRIHLLSDLHNEFRVFQPAAIEADVVILAGDIDTGVRGITWARQAFSCPVLYVPGNHEFYGGHLGRTLLKLRQASCQHVQILDRDEIIVERVRFLGATMWTDFAATGNAPVASEHARSVMNDFRQIRTDNFRRIRPDDLRRQSMKTRDWLRARLAASHDGPTVVVTHHAPTLRSLQGNPHSGTHLDAAFANRWDDLMGDPITLWVHGHVHMAVNYDVAGTRVVCNPRGYPGESTGFDAGLILEV
ncbi:serine/threonine protein phosphatase [Pseudomonas taiwanensis]|uniref:metallophosphoesterase n=1 Tax=Pseudomonas taiwanensis TaxID=470150 RepID=UPI0015BC3EB7|nr:metallophosphoesterase [Pseudomonas taiwanensis]NWL79578.1 serine/threonine protein phosphatase [Pseudomonas taiwanensis]